MELQDKRVVVTGGAGFLGQRVCAELKRRGVPSEDVLVPRSRDFDLVDRAQVVAMLEAMRPDVVIHLAAVVGGIGANREQPARFCRDNLLMGTHLIHESHRLGVEKFVTIGTVCAYPADAEVPFREDAIWEGYPEETNAPYGLAKRMLLALGQAYRRQHGFSVIYLLPVNLYGPGDNFDLETGHVIPAVIRKCVEAVRVGRDTVTLWGDGTPTREFLHVDDAAAAIVLACERYDGPEPINLGSGEELSISELARIIAVETGFDGQIVWDTSMPGGQQRRRVDTSRAWEVLGFEASRDMRQGLRETIAWYKEHRGEL